MSPLELAREFKVAELRRQDEYNRDVTQAWNVFRIEAMSMHNKRMPELKTLLIAGELGRAKGQTRTEMAASLYYIAALNGLTVRTKES